MNEKGLAVSVNMIQDSASIHQDTGKPDITATMAIRLLLDRAATVEEALKLLGEYDLHASMGMMVHFALAEGEKHGIGTKQSHTRYDVLMERLKQNEAMDETDVRDALSSVSKGNFGDSLSTEWSIAFNQTEGKATYYHRENYNGGYVFTIE